MGDKAWAPSLEAFPRWGASLLLPWGREPGPPSAVEPRFVRSPAGPSGSAHVDRRGSVAPICAGLVDALPTRVRTRAEICRLARLLLGPQNDFELLSIQFGETRLTGCAEASGRGGCDAAPSPVGSGRSPHRNVGQNKSSSTTTKRNAIGDIAAPKKMARSTKWPGAQNGPSHTGRLPSSGNTSLSAQPKETLGTV